MHLNLIISLMYSGAVLLTVLCFKEKFKEKFCHEFLAMQLSQNGDDVITPWDTFYIRAAWF